MKSELFDPTAAAHNGRLVKTTGDGFLVEFSSVVDALRCATELRARMAERNPRPRGQPLEPGIAIDLQDALKAAEMRRGSLGLTIRAVHRQKNRAASCRRTRPTPSRNYPRGRNQPLPAGAFLECGGVIL